MRKEGLTGSFWPSKTQEALMQLALVPGVDIERAWQDLQPLDLETLEPGTFALLPFIYRRFQEADVTEPRLPRLAGIYRSNWVKNQLQVERLSSLLGALQVAGVDPLVVGGLPLATQYYAELGQRPVLQLELLVSPLEGADAAAAISNAGWQPAAGSMASARRFQDESSTTSAVLYEGLPPYFLGPVDSNDAVAALREAAVEREIGAASAVTLDASDELLFACGLGARRMIAPQLQWLVDAHQILMRGGLGEDRLVARTRAHRLVRAVVETLTYLSRVTAVGTAASPILRRLDQEHTDRRDNLTYRLAANGLGPLGLAPQGLLDHARRSLAEPLPVAARSLPSVMRDAWDLKGVEQVPVVAARKMLGRTRRAVRGNSDEPPRSVTAPSHPVDAGERDRSASS
jgi:Uncharacterised nucleotidyltransferase